MEILLKTGDQVMTNFGVGVIAHIPADASNPNIEVCIPSLREDTVIVSIFDIMPIISSHIFACQAATS